MEPLVFSVVETPDRQYVELCQSPIQSVPQAAWQKMAANIAYEESLTSYPADALSNRWQEGRAAVAIKDNEIVSYISLILVFSQATRLELSKQIGVAPDCMPNTDLYESATGWTHPAWRRKGISLQLRRQLLKRFNDPNCLYITIAVGLAASPVVARLGWRLVSWGEIACVSSLVGLPRTSAAGKISRTGRQLPPGMKLYAGKHITPDRQTTHPWQHFCHFWVSNLPLAVDLNRQLSGLVNQDLNRWRQAVVAVVANPPEPTWKPFLFNDDFG